MNAGKWLCLVAALLAAPAARADGDAEEEAGEAETPVANVDPLESMLGKAPLPEVCADLSRRFEDEPRGETALLLARCRERQGKLATAWATFGKASAILRGDGDERASEAEAHAAALERRLPKLVIEAPERVPGMAFTRNGRRYGEGILGVALAMDPGHHVISAAAPGHRPIEVAVDLVAGKTETLVLPALEPLSDETPVPPSFARDEGPFVAGVLLAGLGLGAVGVGGILGLVAARDINAAEADPRLCGGDKVCTAEGYHLVERADREGIASTVLVAVGASAVVAGLGVLIWHEKTASVEVAGAVGPQAGRAEIVVRF